jgi:hypothetical protein
MAEAGKMASCGKNRSGVWIVQRKNEERWADARKSIDLPDL